jgi:hypothetical protein
MIVRILNVEKYKDYDGQDVYAYNMYIPFLAKVFPTNGKYKIIAKNVDEFKKRLRNMMSSQWM